MKYLLLIILSLIQGLYSNSLLILSVNSDPKGHLIIINTFGLSLHWDNVNILNNSLFQTLISNSNLLNSFYTCMQIYFQATTGSGFQCGTTQKNCTFNLTTDYIDSIAYFGDAYTNNPLGFILGFGFQYQNFAQIQNFANNLSSVMMYPFIYQFGENVDQYEKQGYRPAGYDINNYLDQIKTFINNGNLPYTFQFSGPGVSSTSINWMNNMSIFFSNNPSGIFTIHMNFFINDMDCTILNLLSQSYLSTRINNVFSGYQTYLQQYRIAISIMKIHPLNGINSVTNSFAACLWALDFIATFSSMGGYGIYFDTNLSSNNYQSSFTSPSNFSDSTTTQVNSLYYAILFYSLFINNNNPNATFSFTKVNNNFNNYNIKTWSVTDGITINVLIINKDMNSNLSGNIDLIAIGMGPAKYFYLQAESLLDTFNIRLSGFTYDNTVDGNPMNLTQFGIYDAYPDKNGIYRIPIKYAQAVIVYIGVASPLVSDQIWNSELMGWQIKLLSNLILLILLFA